MKISNLIISALLLISFHSFGQKEKKVLVFNETEINFKNNVFTIGKTTFKYTGNKKHTNLNSVKSSVSDLDKMNSEIKKNKDYDSRKKPDFYYSRYFDIYILIKKSNQEGYLYPVERVWLVSGKTTN